MKPDAMLEELEAAATALAVKVSYEGLTASVGSGGLCRVKGQYRVIIDKRATAEERCSILAGALAGFDTEPLAMSAKTRELVAMHRVRRAS
ncbi:MAG TPA: hypothetical protein VL172_11725 [Kofleriaceae bacterium]|nr:hypothetical protein [Kofleriaceae bacterium]